MEKNINTALATRIATMKVEPHIVQLVWLAAQVNRDEVKEICDELLNTRNIPERLKKLFPGIEDHFELETWEDGEQLADALAQIQRLGFLAEIGIPECSGFKFRRDGTPLSWGVSCGVSRLEYVYAETPTGLVDEMEKRVNEVFAQYVEKAKAKRN